MRVCEYMPIGIVETDENGKVIPIDTTFFDHEYSDYSAKQLDEYLHGKELTELSKHIIITPELTPLELNNIQFDIDRANEGIASRVTKTYEETVDDYINLWDEMDDDEFEDDDSDY